MRVRTNAVVASAAGVIPVVLGALLFGCDTVYADPITVPFASTVDAGTGATTTRNPLVPCTTPPRENAPCTSTSSVCEVGASPDPTCNAIFVCTDTPSYGSYWTEQSHGKCAATCDAFAGSIIDGAPCDLGDAGTGDEAELQCVTSAATCGCTTGPDGAHAHPRRWVCVKSGPDCPSKRPLLGQPCFGEHSCDYGACDFKRGARMICEGEVWQVEVAPCK